MPLIPSGSCSESCCLQCGLMKDQSSFHMQALAAFFLHSLQMTFSVFFFLVHFEVNYSVFVGHYSHRGTSFSSLFFFFF